MGIVSYAQNLEDVMLWRALKDIKNGFYIDVGANEPEWFSVTKAFSDNGWRGINIEPIPDVFHKLELARERDINLNIAIDNVEKEVTLYISEINDKGLSTISEKTVEESKYKSTFSTRINVKTKTLDSVCEENNVEIVHFLKVDVEGNEKNVLESFSFDKVRPWICIVEATKPTTQIDTSEEWEHILINKKYILTYFDGLNKYYVAEEHNHLVDSFRSPPNVYDGFMLSGHRNALVAASAAEAKVSEAEAKVSKAEEKASEAEEKASEAEAKASEAEAKASEAEAKASEAEAKASEAEAKASEAEAKASEAEAKASEALHQYNLVINSNSWVITKPLRVLVCFIKWFVQGCKAWVTFAPGSRPRRVLKQTLVSLKHRVNTNPKLKVKLIRVFNNWPSIKASLKHIERAEGRAQGHIVTQLSPRGEKIYSEIKKAIYLQKGEN